MNRRTFLATIAGGLLAAALAAEAQPGKKVYRIGFLDFISPDVGHAYSKTALAKRYGAPFDANGRTRANCGRSALRSIAVVDWCLAAKTRHSIILSARRRIESGNLIPSAFAALMFITNSNLVGCSMGRSAGFAPLRILST